MEESKETARKRPLEQPSSFACIRNREDVEDDYLDPIPKRPCTSRDCDSFEEFFALLQRIEATHRNCFGTRNQLNRQEPATKCAQEIKTPASKSSSWRPSFEWEDFSSRRNGKRDVDSSEGQALEKEAVRPDNNNQNQPSPETSPNPALKGLDLNNLPEELPLFQ